MSYIASTEYAWNDETRTRVDWKPLANALNSREASDLPVLAAISEEFSTGCILDETIILGVPYNILMILAERFPVFLNQIDSNDMYPIHVACAFGTSSEFVSHCIDTSPSSGAAKDIEGKTPIHLICQGTWQGFWDIKSNSVAVCMLYCNKPSSVISEDDHGVGSIEYSIESNLGIKFIRTMQRMVSHVNENEACRVARREYMAFFSLSYPKLNECKICITTCHNIRRNQWTNSCDCRCTTMGGREPLAVMIAGHDLT